MELIEEDVFDVARRIKEIDSRYRLYRNGGRFEVYIGRERQSVLPFDRLDARTVEYLRYTRAERRKQLIEELDAVNAQLACAAENAKREELRYKSESLVRYLSGGGSYAPAYDEL